MASIKTPEKEYSFYPTLRLIFRNDDLERLLFRESKE